MKAALAVVRVTRERSTNLAAMLEYVREARRRGADLVVFGEAVPTGLVNDDDPAHDLPLAEPVPGPTVNAVSECAADSGIYVAFGILEREEARIYDSALLIDPSGRVILKYRRISPGWHGPKADPNIYRHGGCVPCVQTPLGSFAFLICGDLFDEDITGKVRARCPDYVLVPFARCFDDGSYDQRRWDEEERDEYVKHARNTGATCLMVNYLSERELDGGSFGGALVVGRDGSVLGEMGLGKPGLLLVDV